MNIIPEFKSLFTDTLKTAISLYKIMIPISIAVKILQYFNLITVLGSWLSPVMEAIGLPGECGIVWATTMVTNIYGGMMAFYALNINGSLTTAQVSVLCSLMLMAHALPVELQVARKAGCRLIVMFLIRFLFGLLTGFVMYHMLHAASWLQDPNVIQWKPELLNNPTWMEWLLAELKKYVMVFFVVMGLLLLMRILKRTGALDKLSEALKPVLGVLGINKEVIPMTVIGLSMGILYGGALIIKEAKEKEIPKMDVFYAFVLMGLCHSLIEDSLLMISLGANWVMVFVFRMAFALIITWLLVRFMRLFPERKLVKWLTT